MSQERSKGTPLVRSEGMGEHNDGVGEAAGVGSGGTNKKKIRKCPEQSTGKRKITVPELVKENSEMKHHLKMLLDDKKSQQEQIVSLKEQIKMFQQEKQRKRDMIVSMKDRFEVLECEERTMKVAVESLVVAISAARMMIIKLELESQYLRQVVVQKQVDPVPVDEAIELKKFYADAEKIAGAYFKGKHQKSHAKIVFDGLQSVSIVNQFTCMHGGCSSDIDDLGNCCRSFLPMWCYDEVTNYKSASQLLTLKHIHVVHAYQTRAMSTLHMCAHVLHVVRHSWQNFCQNCLMHMCTCTHVHSWHLYIWYNNIV